MPFPTLNDDQANAFNRFLLERRPPGPQFPMLPQGGFATLQPPTLAGLATAPPTQNMGQAYLKDQMQEREAVSALGTPIINQSLPDTELLKQQMGAGLSSMFDTSHVTMTPQGTMDYGGMKPIRGGAEELFQNPQFIRLLRADPRKAEQAYSAITGRRMGEDFQQRQMATLARQKDIGESLRGGVLKGDIRQNPEFGFLERMTETPNPTGIGPATKAWGTMDYQEQELYSRGWEGAFGEKLPRGNPIVDMPAPKGATPQQWTTMKPMIWNRYKEIVGKGEMAPREALMAATQEIIKRVGGEGAPSGATTSAEPSLPERGLSATLQMAQVPDFMANAVSRGTGMPFEQLKAGMQMGGMGSPMASQAQKLAILARMQATQPGPPPAEAGEAAYQQYETEQARLAGQRMSAATEKGIQSFAQTMGEYTQPVADVYSNKSEAARKIANFGVDLYNLPNRAKMLIGGGDPMYQWKRPTTKEEYAVWQAEKQKQQASPDRPLDWNKAEDRELIHQWQSEGEQIDTSQILNYPKRSKWGW